MGDGIKCSGSACLPQQELFIKFLTFLSVPQASDFQLEMVWQSMPVHPMVQQVFCSSEPCLLWQVPTQKQHPEEAGQGSWGTASEWAPARGGGAGKCQTPLARITKLAVHGHLYSQLFSCSIFSRRISADQPCDYFACHTAVGKTGTCSQKQQQV